MDEFLSVLVSHIYCEANGVTHRLVFIACSPTINELWSNETPVIIQDVLYENLCNCSRGNMSPSLYNHNSNLNNMGIPI